MMDPTVILSTAYLPPIPYFVEIVHSQSFFIEANETYQKQTYRNRCSIYTANGKFNLSIPVVKPDGNQTKTRDVLIDYSQGWYRHHWRTITSAYNSSPYFLYFMDELLAVYEQRNKFLMDFNTNLLEVIIKLMGLQKEIRFTGSFEKNYQTAKDLRSVISPKNPTVHNHQQTAYFQSFSTRHGFIPGLSIVDLLFHEGPETLSYLKAQETLD